MKRVDINTILIIGSGPIIIGQGCEFDYSGTQSCKALKQLGYKTILINSNPATIMTDPQIADATYIVPLDIEHLTTVIEKERPDALLPNMGGQVALNLCIEAKEILDKYHVEVLGVNVQAIIQGEDRLKFKETMKLLGIATPSSFIATTVDEALTIADRLEYPVILRPAFTLGGTGGGIANTAEELKAICHRSLQYSIAKQVLVEKCISGWCELELEVIRDKKSNMITIASIENIDPMGIHTGDSVCVVPIITVSTEIQVAIKEIAYKILNHLQIIGGVNIQFAYNKKTNELLVIEINPRTSRSSALASKASGFPIAYISTMLACGITLDEIPYKTNDTLNHYLPNNKYFIIKFPKWSFEKFYNANDVLGSQMRSIGETMSIGKTFKEAWQKAVRSLEDGHCGPGLPGNTQAMSLNDIYKELTVPSSKRQYLLYDALKKKADIKKLHELTKIDIWFLKQMKELADFEKTILSYHPNTIPNQVLLQAKKNGFSDKYLAQLFNTDERHFLSLRNRYRIVERWCSIDTIQNSPAAFYATYNDDSPSPANIVKAESEKVVVLGSGPNRVGQGIEFDYCCVHAVKTLKTLGFETILINNNPETVSTDYDVADKLYFETVNVENVVSICKRERPIGVLAQFGGQTPLNLISELENNNITILGTSANSIVYCENRYLFKSLMKQLNIPYPKSASVSSLKKALAFAKTAGFPLIVRPSFVLGGHRMQVLSDNNDLLNYFESNQELIENNFIILEQYLENGIECDIDAVFNGTDVIIPEVLEQISPAGIHSGDSTGVIPPIHLTPKQIETIYNYTQKVGKALNLIGIYNVQLVIFEKQIYLIEVNPRASRTVPIFSKTCNLPLVDIAVKSIMDDYYHKQPERTLSCHSTNLCCVKEPVFSYKMLPEVNPVPGPEMYSTGEVLGLSENYANAYYKAKKSAFAHFGKPKTILIVSELFENELEELAKKIQSAPCSVYSFGKITDYLQKAGITVFPLIANNYKSVLDVIQSGKIDCVFLLYTSNEPEQMSAIRKTCIFFEIPLMNSIREALCYFDFIDQFKNATAKNTKSLQELYE